MLSADLRGPENAVLGDAFARAIEKQAVDRCDLAVFDGAKGAQHGERGYSSEDCRKPKADPDEDSDRGCDPYRLACQ